MVNQDGSLVIERNSIRNFSPINFWNPLNKIVQTGNHRLTWKSSTTGGLAGVIIDLEDRDAGSIDIKLNEIGVCEEIRSIGFQPRIHRYDGLDKKLEIYRLPSERSNHKVMEFTIQVRDLNRGDNPLFVRVAQEDGHIAWSSPIYAVRER
jgi:hypothetical protein